MQPNLVAAVIVLLAVPGYFFTRDDKNAIVRTVGYGLLILSGVALAVLFHLTE